MAAQTRLVCVRLYGFNISIIAFYLSKLAQRVSQRREHWIVIGGLIIYTLLVGAGASVVRAAIMGGLGVVALHYGRQAFALNSLAAASLLMTLLNPFTLWDVGFQLSFLATLGLLLYTQPLTRWVERVLRRVTSDARTKQALSFLSDSLIVTLAAQFTTTPLIVAIFHRFSLIGLVTNFLILPIQPAIMIFGGMATLTQMAAAVLASIPFVGILVGAVAQVLAWCAYLFLQYTILIVQWTAAVPFGSFEVPRFDWAIIVLIYILIFLATRFSLKHLTGVFFSRPTWAIGSIAFISIFIWTSARSAPDPRTHIQFLATASGDAIFIRTAEGERILIDGSGEPSALLGHLGEQTTLWDRRLDLVIATHLDEQNLSAVSEVLQRYSVGQVALASAPARPNLGYTRLQGLLIQ